MVFNLISLEMQNNLISLERQNIITKMWPRQNGRHFADDIFKCISSIKTFTFLSIFRRTLFPWVQYARKKKKLLKMCCRQIPDSLEQKFWNVQVICIRTFLRATFFVTPLVVIQKVLPLNHKDVGMHCNEGSNVWSSNSMCYQPIFLQNDCVCRDP